MGARPIWRGRGWPVVGRNLLAISLRPAAFVEAARLGGDAMLSREPAGRAERQVEHLACISASTFKADHPASRLVDGDPQTYWQCVRAPCHSPLHPSMRRRSRRRLTNTAAICRSDGQLPHYVQVDFAEAMAIRVGPWRGFSRGLRVLTATLADRGRAEPFKG